MSDHISLLVDGNDPALSYGPGWASVDRPITSSMLGGSVMVGSGALTLNASFYGTSIAIYGYLNASSTPTVQIDNATAQGTFPNLPYYGPWYTSTWVADHQHDLALALARPQNSSATALVDYIVLTAGPSTPLTGKSLIADDYDKDIQYDGTWDTAFGTVFPARDPNNGTSRLAYQNTTHSTKKPGSGFTFFFTGSSVAVYGILQSHLGGRWSAKFSIDGAAPNTYSADFSNSTIRPFDRTNTQLYRADVPAGPHTLDVRVTEVAGDQAFVLDYIVYNASFPSALAKPQRPQTAKSHPMVIPVGAIVGGSVGVAVAIILLLLFLWRRGRRDASLKSHPVDLTQHTQMETQSSSRPASLHGPLYRKSFRHSNATLVDDRGAPPSPPDLPQLPSFAFPGPVTPISPATPTPSPSSAASPATPRDDEALALALGRIDPFPAAVQAKPHYRKKSEMMGSFDSGAYAAGSAHAVFFPGAGQGQGQGQGHQSQLSLSLSQSGQSGYGGGYGGAGAGAGGYAFGQGYSYPHAQGQGQGQGHAQGHDRRASVSTSHLSLDGAPPVPPNPYLGRKTSLGGGASGHAHTHARRKSFADAAAEPVNRPSSAHSYMPSHAHTPSHLSHLSAHLSSPSHSHMPSRSARTHHRTPSHTSTSTFSPTSHTPTSAPFPFQGALPHAELRRRTQEILELVGRLEGDMALGAREEDVWEMRRRLEVLTREEGRGEGGTGMSGMGGGMGGGSMGGGMGQVLAINTRLGVPMDSRPGSDTDEPPPAYNPQGPLTC